MSWTVVQFVDGTEVEAVPTSWLFGGDQCYWPTFDKQRTTNDIRKCVEPNTCWPMYKVRIFKDGTYTDYLMARNKANRATATSDLNTDPEQGKKKLRKKNNFFSPWDDSDDVNSSDDEKHWSNIPPPPELEYRVRVPYNKIVVEEADNDCISTEENISGADSYLKSQHNPKSSLNGTPVGTPVSTSLPKKQILNAKVQVHDEAVANGSKETEKETHCSCCVFHTKKLEHALLVLAQGQKSLRAQLLQLREDFQMSEKNKDEIIISSFYDDFDCPLKSDDEIQGVERYLNDQENYGKLVKEFAKTGGRDTYDFIRRCLTNTISNALASSYSYHGAKGKKPFKCLKLHNALLESLLTRKSHKSG